MDAIEKLSNEVQKKMDANAVNVEKSRVKTLTKTIKKLSDKISRLISREAELEVVSEDLKDAAENLQKERAKILQRYVFALNIIAAGKVESGNDVYDNLNKFALEHMKVRLNLGERELQEYISTHVKDMENDVANIVAEYIEEKKKASVVEGLAKVKKVN